MKLRYHILSLCMLAVIYTSGCGTMLAYKHNKNTAVKEYVYNTKDDKLIKAYNDGDIQGIGIDITATDSIFRSYKSVGVQLLGALADALVGYGAVYALDEARDSNSSKQTNVDGDSTTITTIGKNNTINISTTENTNPK